MALTVSNEITWEAPPAPLPSAGGAQVSEEWLAVAQLLADNPHQWARVAQAEKNTQAVALAHRINKGGNRAFEPAGSYEGQARKNADGTGTVWARYVGEDVDPVKVLAEGNDLSSLKAMAKDLGVQISGTKLVLAGRIVKKQAEMAPLDSVDEADARNPLLDEPEFADA